MTRMHQVSTRLLQADDFSVVLHEILDAAVEISGAQMGNIQLLEGDHLRITAQRGFDTPFLDISKNLDDIITSWNGGAARIFGYAAAEAIGQSIALIIPPDRRNEEVEIIQRLREGHKIEHFETQRVAKDGRLTR